MTGLGGVGAGRNGHDGHAPPLFAFERPIFRMRFGSSDAVRIRFALEDKGVEHPGILLLPAYLGRLPIGW